MELIIWFSLGLCTLFFREVRDSKIPALWILWGGIGLFSAIYIKLLYNKPRKYCNRKKKGMKTNPENYYMNDFKKLYK